MENSFDAIGYSFEHEFDNVPLDESLILPRLPKVPPAKAMNLQVESETAVYYACDNDALRMMQDIVTENRRLLLTQLRAVEKENVELKKKLKELEEQKKKLSKGDSDGWTLVPYEAPPNAASMIGAVRRAISPALELLYNLGVRVTETLLPPAQRPMQDSYYR